MVAVNHTLKSSAEEVQPRALSKVLRRTEKVMIGIAVTAIMAFSAGGMATKCERGEGAVKKAIDTLMVKLRDTSDAAHNNPVAAGYIVETKASEKTKVTAVSGSWIVNDVPYTNGAPFLSAQLVGVGGGSLFIPEDTTIIQAGSFSALLSGNRYFALWYGMYPNKQVIVDTGVSAGDVINAGIHLIDSTTGTWFINLQNVTKKRAVSFIEDYRSSRRCAEFVYQIAPMAGGNGKITYADFGEADFGPAYTGAYYNIMVINGIAKRLGSLRAIPVVMSTGKEGGVVATPVGIEADSSSFRVVLIKHMPNSELGR